jgi:hypothetical protein
MCYNHEQLTHMKHHGTTNRLLLHLELGVCAPSIGPPDLSMVMTLDQCTTSARPCLAEAAWQVAVQN